MSETTTGTTGGYQRRLKSVLGELPITSGQAQKLEVRSHSQLSLYLEACCLRLSANVSYQHAAVCLHEQAAVAASFRENAVVID